MSRPGSPTPSLTYSASSDDDVASVDTEGGSVPRLYMYARLRRGEPHPGSPVAFKDLRYWLRVEFLPAAITIPLVRMNAHRAVVYSWLSVFTRSDTFATMELPTHMVTVIRKLLTFFYRAYHEEKGFTLDLYRNVCTAIVHRTEYGVPSEPVDETPWLMGLVKYVEEIVGQNALEERRYMLGEIRVAQELVLKVRSYNKDQWEWPCLLDELAYKSKFGERVGVTTDPRHASPLLVERSTLIPLPQMVKDLIQKHVV